MKKTDIDLSQYEEIVSVTFDNEDPHLAITHKAQGYSANGWHKSLISKSEDTLLTSEIIKALEQVEVKLSFEEFLRRFFHIYGDDAELLTKLLGFETEYEDYLNTSEYTTDEDKDNYQEYLNSRLSRFNLTKSTTLDDVSPEHLVEIITLQKKFEANSEQLGITFDESGEEPLKEDVSKASEPKTDIEGTMDIKELMKSAEAQEIIKGLLTTELDKAKADFDAQLEAKTVELEKAAQELETFRAEKAARVKTGFTNLVKSLTFIEEADQEAVVATLMKAKDSTDVDVKVIVAQLEKAQEQLEKAKETFVTAEDGVDTVEETVIDKSSEDLEEFAKRYAGKEFLD